VGKISGTVIDSATKQPLDYVAVAIMRSGGKVPINGVLTDDKGAFKINDMHPGSYKLVITYLGYVDKIIDPVVTSPEHPDKNIGVVVMSESKKAHKLNEVVIQGQGPLIENHIDKLVYNAEKDIT